MSEFLTRPHALPWIGYTGMWYRAWVIEEGENEYAGQWAWMPVDYKACGTVFGWTPECDLTFADQPELIANSPTAKGG